MTTTKFLVTSASVAAALCLAAPACADWSGLTLPAAASAQPKTAAQDSGAAPESAADPAHSLAGATQDSEVSGSFSVEQQIDAGTLEDHRGGQSTTLNQVNKMTLDAVLSNNVTDNVVTGSNSISEGSFAGTTGFPMVIQNTGNNVIIQNATILNLNVK